MSAMSVEKQAALKAGAAKGGAAAKGEKKRRWMQGKKPGRGSAGRVNAGAKKQRAAEALVAVCSYADVKAACNEWLRGRGLKVGGFRELMLGDIHEAMGKKCQVIGEE